LAGEKKTIKITKMDYFKDKKKQVVIMKHVEKLKMKFKNEI
jgi:hypothetical protein